MYCDRYFYQVTGYIFLNINIFCQLKLEIASAISSFKKGKKMLQTIQHQKGLLLFTLFCLIYILCIILSPLLCYCFPADTRY